MKRRHFLRLALTPVALAVLPRIVPAEATLPSTRLGAAWTLPHDTDFELWPTQYGLGLAEAMSAVLSWSIPATSRLILRLEDGVHDLGEQIHFRHPDGPRLAIIGNRANPEHCVIRWQRAEDAIYVPAGYHLGEIDGFTLEHTNPSGRGNGSALIADSGGSIQCGRSLIVRGFYYGFQARYGGIIRCCGTQCFNAGDAGYFAFNGGHLDATASRSVNARDDTLHLGSGYVAEYGGTINAEQAIAMNNALAGFTALSNGAIRAYYSHAERNGVAGYIVKTSGSIVAHDGMATHNCGQGQKVDAATSAFEANHFTNENNDAPAQSCLLASP